MDPAQYLFYQVYYGQNYPRCTCADKYSDLTEENFWDSHNYTNENELLFYWLFYGQNNGMFCHCYDWIQEILKNVPQDKFFEWYKETGGHM